MKVFSDPRYNVDVLKVEVPVNMNFVEGFTKEGVEPVYTQEALRLFKNNLKSHWPTIHLLKVLVFLLNYSKKHYALQKEAGSTFNELCYVVVATWKIL